MNRRQMGWVRNQQKTRKKKKRKKNQLRSEAAAKDKTLLRGLFYY